MVGTLLILVSPSMAASPATTFTFEGAATVKLEPGQDKGSDVLSLKLTGDAAVRGGTLTLQDHAARDRPAVTLAFEPGDPNVRDGSLAWFVKATVAGLPANSTISRLLSASYAGVTQTLQYTITNKSEIAFSWKLAPVKEARRWNAGDPLRFAVSVGPVPATAVRLLPSAFADAEGLNVLPRILQLCVDAKAACDGRAITLGANETHFLSIRAAGTDSVEPGEYKGSVTLIAAEKPDGESFPIVLSVSDLKLQMLGAALIALGLGLAWLVNVVLQRRNEQNMVLMPAALLMEHVGEIRSERARIAALTSAPLTGVGAYLTDLNGSLSQASLRSRGYLGDLLTFFNRTAGTVPATQTYQQFLAEAESRVASLSLLFDVGVREAAAAWDTNLSKAERDIVLEAIADMDAMLPQPPAPPLARDDLASRLRARLVAMRGALNAARGVADDTAHDAARVGYNSERIAFETAAINLTGWAVFALLSFVVGCYVLIASNPAFGQWKDLLVCLLWGFGLPAAGEKLSTLSNPTIAKSFGVTLTRGAA